MHFSALEQATEELTEMTLDDKAKPNTSETMVCMHYDILNIQCTYFH